VFRPVDAEQRGAVFADWFSALSHFAIEAVEHGVSDVIASKRDTFWPAVGEVRGRIEDRLRGVPKVSSRCQTCHGSSWVDAGPHKANGGLIYEPVMRCPDCGIPAPKPIPGASRLEPLNGVEYRAWADAKAEGKPLLRVPSAEPQEAKAS